MDMQNMDHSMMNMDMPSADPSSKAFFEANMKMHKDMNISFSGDADIDFVTGMIPHHQGAIDMAQIVLKYGKNEEIKTLAQNIIKAQQEEIAFMQNWFTGSQQQ
ncbi:DUF305 domain-containing protein [Candidatus Gracilibacteria bacterium]|nr:DUF305 domain-containing protein [Candidatus Gracilibacteria bacterium]